MKKRRGAGNRGGRGMAGSGKRADQKKPTILKLYGSSYFGKRGEKSFFLPGTYFLSFYLEIENCKMRSDSVFKKRKG